jgi:WXG100 family type VII secretion target
MDQIVQLKYDELETVVKKFKDEGEDIVMLHLKTRQRVHDLYPEWVGEGADKFFEEMETILLPALARLAQALFFSQNTLHKIMKIINEADIETAGLFKHNFAQFDTSSLGGIGLHLGNLSDENGTSLDFGSGNFEGTFPQQSAGATSMTDTNPNLVGSDSQQQSQQEPEIRTEDGNSSVGTIGGIGRSGTIGEVDSSSSSQGASGDLNDMGSGLNTQTMAGNSAEGSDASLNSPITPDHIGSAVEGEEMHATSGGISGGNQASGSSAGAAAATTAGVAGAAIGTVKKTIRKRKLNRPIMP